MKMQTINGFLKGKKRKCGKQYQIKEITIEDAFHEKPECYYSEAYGCYIVYLFDFYHRAVCSVSAENEGVKSDCMTSDVVQHSFSVFIVKADSEKELSEIFRGKKAVKALLVSDNDYAEYKKFLSDYNSNFCFLSKKQFRKALKWIFENSVAPNTDCERREFMEAYFRDDILEYINQHMKFIRPAEIPYPETISEYFPVSETRICLVGDSPFGEDGTFTEEYEIFENVLTGISEKGEVVLVEEKTIGKSENKKPDIIFRSIKKRKRNTSESALNFLNEFVDEEYHVLWE